MNPSLKMIIRNRSSKDIIGALSQPSSILPSHRIGGSSSTSTGEGNGLVAPSRNPSIHRWFLFILICIFGVLCYSLLLYHSPLISIRDEHTRPSSISVEKVTIVMNTFKRHDMMLDAIDYYSSCRLVKYIYITWSEEEPPPQRITAKFTDSKHPQVMFNIETVDSLNNRFKPIASPHTDAILSVDDDMRIPCSDLNLAYEVWRSSQRSLVGFMPRIHLRNSDNSLEYRCWWRVWWHGVYSIILTKAAILHHDFLRDYTYKMDAAVRTMVDDRRNCEDIAMQFFIANETSLPPIYVKGRLDDLGVLNGISTSQNIVRAGHMNQRSDCLNELEKLFRGVPLVSSRIIVDSAGNGWTNSPSTWYEYISSDLWKW